MCDYSCIESITVLLLALACITQSRVTKYANNPNFRESNYVTACNVEEINFQILSTFRDGICGALKSV